MVEAPGTAPGSDGFITTAVYCHSRLAPALLNIGAQGGQKKSMGTAAAMLARDWPIYVALARNGAAVAIALATGLVTDAVDCPVDFCRSRAARAHRPAAS